jgi:hypothetical protein
MFPGIDIKYRNNNMFEHKADVIKTSKSKTGYVYISTNKTYDAGLETMVFLCNADGNVVNWVDDLGCDRYDNETAAEIGHQNMINKWQY